MRIQQLTIPLLIFSAVSSGLQTEKAYAAEEVGISVHYKGHYANLHSLRFLVAQRLIRFRTEHMLMQ